MQFAKSESAHICVCVCVCVCVFVCVSVCLCVSVCVCVVGGLSVQVVTSLFETSCKALNAVGLEHEAGHCPTSKHFRSGSFLQ